ncbi:hypothetical protein [Streptomyces sp. SID13031]|uniref:hypothetical protein n=1 Tax=Streptomyces sp. SID13031 TaxID=2706046 RepID=UPI0013C9125C|nr:hypothetical protein [Streptomyces sp. SID13031]NEA35427.1 hypothetical protein [Streptomyces sp. SID13031]
MKVTSLKGMMDEQANAAVRISGADHSSWNGKLDVTDPARKVRGAVKWDNTIEYSDRSVNEPLREMFDNARVHNQDPRTLQSYREAVKTVLHENTHVLAAEGTQHSDAKDAFQNPSVKSLEEGVTELYSYANVDRYIDDLGLEEVAPGIGSADANRSYKQYVPAAETFTNGIARESGVDKDEVVRRLAVVNAEQKFQVAAETLYDNSELPGLVPEQGREAAVQRIAAAMRPPFEPLPGLEGLNAQELRRESAKAGGRAADAGIAEVQAIRGQWSAPQAEQRVERGAQQQAGQQAQNNPQQTQNPQQMQEPAQSPQSSDLQHAMRAGLSGSAPMSSAHVLAAGEQGSRRSGGQGGPERQGPERGE